MKKFLLTLKYLFAASMYIPLFVFTYVAVMIYGFLKTTYNIIDQLIVEYQKLYELFKEEWKL